MRLLRSCFIHIHILFRELIPAVHLIIPIGVRTHLPGGLFALEPGYSKADTASAAVKEDARIA